MNISRDTDNYELTVHSFNRAKQRNIEAEYIKETIQDGYVQEAKKGYPNMRFLKEFIELDDPIGVVANVKTGEIITVYHNTQFEIPSD